MYRLPLLRSLVAAREKRNGEVKNEKCNQWHKMGNSPFSSLYNHDVSLLNLDRAYTREEV
jgi:hypothetical protein